MLAKFHGVIRALVGSRKVSIAAVHGNCLGGGAELAMVCDLAYTSELATWGFPEIKLGCYPPVAVTALAALVGQKRAADLVLTGRCITGREAAEHRPGEFALCLKSIWRHAVQHAVDHLVAAQPSGIGHHQESDLRVGFNSFRQRTGPSREDLLRRVDENGRRAGGNQRVSRKAAAGVEGK